jgi:hypothetical protein
MKEHIEEAIEAFRSRESYYAKAERYYAGRHDLAFATDKFRNAFGSLFREFALNLCPAVVDSLRDKLRIAGFSVDEAAAGASVADLNRMTARIWDAGRMGTRAGEIHREMLVYGDAYMIVWPDFTGFPRLFPNRAANCTVVADDEDPNLIIRAVKHWRTKDKRIRLNIFYPDRIEKFVATDAFDGPMTSSDRFVSVGEMPVVENPFGRVPVFHFANNARLGEAGTSELDAVIPIQDGLNKSMLDMLVAMEFSAYRQRWAAGIETDIDGDGKPVSPFTAGVDHLWISQNPEAKFGDFATANLEQFLKVKDSFRGDIASVTGVPLHYFTVNSARTHASGEALRNAEARFLAKVRDRQASLGQVWADAMGFALEIAGMGKGNRLVTRWEDPSPLSDREQLENALLRRRLGRTEAEAQEETGYGQADAAEK